MLSSRRKVRCTSAIQSPAAKSHAIREQTPRILSAKDIRATLRITKRVLQRSNFAYFTLVSTNDALPGAVLLGWSIKSTKTLNDCVVMVVPEIGTKERNLLRKTYDKVVEVDPIICRMGGKLRHFSSDERTTYSRRMTKCNVFKFIEYEKVLYIDSSSYVLWNIDELFAVKAPAGISSLINSLNQTKYHGVNLPRDHVSKSLQLSCGIRGHVLLLTPSLSIFHFSRSYKGPYNEVHFIQPDVEFLTRLFQDQWTHIHSKFAWIPWQANCIKGEEARVICLEGFHPWKDHCYATDEVCQWRLKSIHMCKQVPGLRTIFNGTKWFSDLEEKCNI